MKAIDLFSGCGGLSLGFQNAGVDIVAAFDNWDAAINTYNANFKHNASKLDLSNVNETKNVLSKYEFDMIIGGTPCQEFSNAGTRTEGDLALLSEKFAEVVCFFKPKWFVMENVDRFEGSDTYETVHRMFRQAGYGLTCRKLDASLYGVPQKRKRFFCIGLLDAKDNFMDALLIIKQTRKHLTVRDYLTNIFGENIFGINYFYRHPRNYGRRGVFSIDEPAPTIRGVNRPLPKQYKKHGNDASFDYPNIRALTSKERSIIQTFPNTFVFSEIKSDAEQMIGNAVPIKLAESVADQVLLYDQQGATLLSVMSETQKIAFKNWLKNNKNYVPNSARDVISRISRIDSIMPIPDKMDDYYFFSLRQCEEFKSLEKTIKSQLKRSVQLYWEFIESINEGADT